MKTLFLIDGAAGTGKSDLVAYLIRKKNRVATLIPKYTTREQRSEERDRTLPTDLRFPPDSRERFMKRTKEPGFYWYTYGGKNREEFYGFYAEDIKASLEDAEYGLIIVRDFDTIQAVQRNLRHVRCVSVFVYTDRELVEKRLRREGYSDDAIRFRLGRQPIAWSDYLKHSTQYDEKIINSSDRKDFELLVEALFKAVTDSPTDEIGVGPYTTLPLVRPLVGFKSQMEKRLEAKPYERNVFLMMKFRASNARVHKFIERTLAEHGMNCVRADDTFWDITGDVYNPVAVLYCCKFGIALFDEPEAGNEYSPNVAYELGMMHDQGKDCLILRHSSLSGMPFDLVSKLHVNYEDNLELDEIIENWVGKIAT